MLMEASSQLPMKCSSYFYPMTQKLGRALRYNLMVVCFQSLFCSLNTYITLDGFLIKKNNLFILHLLVSPDPNRRSFRRYGAAEELKIPESRLGY